jgi:hypothetical protein
MSARAEARKRFVEQVQNAIDEAQAKVRGLFDDPSAKVEIVHTSVVPQIIADWGSQAQLNWALAQRKCSSNTRSCFIGIDRRMSFAFLSLVRVSRAGELDASLPRA